MRHIPLKRLIPTPILPPWREAALMTSCRNDPRAEYQRASEPVNWILNTMKIIPSLATRKRESRPGLSTPERLPRLMALLLTKHSTVRSQQRA